MNPLGHNSLLPGNAILPEPSTTNTTSDRESRTIQVVQKLLDPNPNKPIAVERARELLESPADFSEEKASRIDDMPASSKLKKTTKFCELCLEQPEIAIESLNSHPELAQRISYSVFAEIIKKADLALIEKLLSCNANVFAKQNITILELARTSDNKDVRRLFSAYEVAYLVQVGNHTRISELLSHSIPLTADEYTLIWNKFPRIAARHLAVTAPHCPDAIFERHMIKKEYHSFVLNLIANGGSSLSRTAKACKIKCTPIAEKLFEVELKKALENQDAKALEELLSIHSLLPIADKEKAQVRAFLEKDRNHLATLHTSFDTFTKLSEQYPDLLYRLLERYPNLHKRCSEKCFEAILENPESESLALHILQKGYTPSPEHLSAAVRMKRKKVVDAILAKQVDVSAPDAQKRTPLHYALELGDEELTDKLLKAAANLFAVDSFGKTPRALTRNPALAQKLYKREFKQAVEDKLVDKLLLLASEREYMSTLLSDRSLLQFIAPHKELAAVGAILISAGVDPFYFGTSSRQELRVAFDAIPQPQRTSLRLAIDHDNTELVKTITAHLPPLMQKLMVEKEGLITFCQNNPLLIREWATTTTTPLEAALLLNDRPLYAAIMRNLPEDKQLEGINILLTRYPQSVRSIVTFFFVADPSPFIVLERTKESLTNKEEYLQICNWIKEHLPTRADYKAKKAYYEAESEKRLLELLANPDRELTLTPCVPPEKDLSALFDKDGMPHPFTLILMLLKKGMFRINTMEVD